MLLCFCAASALADQVTLKNGDRLSGTIVKTDDDKLEMKSEFAGDVKLPWSAVGAIVSAEPLHIALKNGRTIVGVVTTKDEKFEVAAPSGPLRPPRLKWWRCEIMPSKTCICAWSTHDSSTCGLDCWTPAFVSPEEIR